MKNLPMRSLIAIGCGVVVLVALVAAAVAISTTKPAEVQKREMKLRFNIPECHRRRRSDDGGGTMECTLRAL